MKPWQIMNREHFYSILYEMTGSENVREALDVLEEDHGIVPDVDM